MRQQGYTVKITGFLPVDKKSITAQIYVLTAIETGDAAAILHMCKDVRIEQNLRSREVDADGMVTPPKPRKPRTATAKPGKKAA